MLRMYDVEGKLLSRIKSIHVDSSPCVSVKERESKEFRIDSEVVSCPLHFSIYIWVQ